MEPREIHISQSYARIMPFNCPVMEYTGDGVYVGVCTFHLENGTVCPRHGDISKLKTKVSTTNEN